MCHGHQRRPGLRSIRPLWESLRNFTIPGWYQDAKLGIFIHWGVYSVPAFGTEWYARYMYEQDRPEFGHHIATYGPQSRFGYKDFIPMFRGEKFDPAAWASNFKRAGARYVVPAPSTMMASPCTTAPTRAGPPRAWDRAAM
jgi:alpha-L-fucosidase